MANEAMFEVRITSTQFTDALGRLAAVEEEIAGATGGGGTAEDAGRLVRLDAGGALSRDMLPAPDDTTQRRYDVMRHGAVWDGKSHPLSERFATLEEARRTYPHATALDEEIDWAATQAAINQIVLDWSMYGSRFGGVVALPSGTGQFNRALFYPANPVWVWQNFPVVDIRGQGRGSTILEWRNNNAPIEAGYVLQPRKADVAGGAVRWSGDHAQLHADCRLSGFALRGPGNWRGWTAPTSLAEFVARYGFEPEDWTAAYNRTNPRVGQIYEAYSGLSAGERTCIDDVFVNGFHVGVNWRGGQKTARLLFTENCYYGVHLTFCPAAHGDFVMEKCNLSGRFAAIALAPDTGWYGHMDTCFVGGAPYAVYKEGTDEALSDTEARAKHDGHWPDLATGVWTHCQFESVGNAIFAEGNLTRRHELRDLTLQNCLFREVGGTSHAFPASAIGYRGSVMADALIDARSWKRVSILRSHDPDRWTPRGAAIFRCQNAPDDVLIDSCDGYLAAAARSGKPLFELGAAAGRTDGAVRLRGNGWEGSILRIGSTHPALRAGDLVGLYGLFCGQNTPAARRIVGVAMENNPDPSAIRHLAVATASTAALVVNIASEARLTNENAFWKQSPTEPGRIVDCEEAEAAGIACGRRNATQWWCYLDR